MTTSLPVSVVIPCHDERRWTYLIGAIASARAQTPEPIEIVVVIDHNEALYQRAQLGLPGVTVLRNQFCRGVSGNRNTGAYHVRTPLIAFLDDDVTAGPNWLAQLVAPFADPQVVGTGGAIKPVWEKERPVWVPDEFLWAFGGSYTGMPTTVSTVRNVWSASMVVRRDAMLAVGGFRTDFGKVGDRSRPEDTELCLRMAEAANGRWVYVPQSVIHHPVPADRDHLGYYLTRCYHEGRGKVAMARLLRGKQSLGSERTYLRLTLPNAVRRGLADALSGRDPAGARRAGAVVAGVTAAGVGAMVELFRFPSVSSAAAAGRAS
jgi:cellulose synthase/poly-beta-1,6-N-acetylglucosamine synthase-like glycosyltransferase